jgi:hypothetical protein
MALQTSPTAEGHILLSPSPSLYHRVSHPQVGSGEASRFAGRAPLEAKEPDLADTILTLYQEQRDQALKQLFSRDEKAFLIALKEISTKEVEVEEESEPSVAVSSKKGKKSESKGVESAPSAAPKINYAEVANTIAGMVGGDYFEGKEVKVITPKDLEKAFFTAKAKKDLAPQILETELSRAQAEAMWNANAKNVFTSPFNLFRTVVAVSTMAVNFFASIGYALGSISCFADAEVKTLRLETARDLLSRMGHDTLNAVCGLGQAIPFVGTFLTNMLENRRYKYETEAEGTQKHQGESWPDFTQRRINEKAAARTRDILVHLKKPTQAELDEEEDMTGSESRGEESPVGFAYSGSGAAFPTFPWAK